MRIKTEVINNKRGVFRALRFLVCITLLLVATPKAGAQEVTVWNEEDIDTDWYDNHTGDNEFTITTAAELAGLAKLVNDKTDDFSGKTVKLGADIVLNDTRDWMNWGENLEELNMWTAIGIWGTPFSGTFDGQGHVVRGIYISKGQDRQGLFGYIQGGKVMNVGVEESFIKGKCYVGGIAGQIMLGSSISNCYNTGAVSGLYYVGGIAGEVNASSVSNCYNTGAVSGLEDYVGGIAGTVVTSSVSNCYYLKGSADKGIGYMSGGEDFTKSMSQEQFTSGEVACLLQEGQDDPTTPVWGQYLGTDVDNLPVLGGPKVVADGSGYKNALWPGENENEYLISTADELRVFAELVNSGDRFSGKTVKLANDIELNDTDGWDKWNENTEGLNTWTVIGMLDYYNPNPTPFCGTFDGQGHVVRGIYISKDQQDYQGLFGYIRDGTVKNVGVEESFIKGRYSVGGIAGIVYGSSVSNCYNTGAVSGSSDVGGIAGFLASGGSYEFSNCYFLFSEGLVGIGSGSDPDGITFKTKTEFASGEVANLLGKEWAQAIGGDDFPVLMSHLSDNEKDKKKVYTVTLTYPKAPDNAEEVTLVKYGNYGQEIGLIEGDITSIEDYLLTWNKELPITINGKDVEVTGAWQLDEIVINTSIDYDGSQHGGKLLRITSTGTLTVDIADASVKRLTIEEGGTLLLTEPLTVTNGFTMRRTFQNKWETFCLPTGLTAEDMEINAGGGIWLSTGFLDANSQGWTEASGLTNGTPYIIAGDDVNGTEVTFSYTDYPIELSATSADLETPDTDGILLFQGNPSFAEKEVHDVYALNDAGTAFELQEGTYTMRPFECVLTANAATRGVLKSLRLDDGSPTGVIELLRGDFRAWGADGLLHLRSAAPADVHIYNVGGSPVAHLPALAGDRTLRLPAGIYLVKYKQTTIKIKL